MFDKKSYHREYMRKLRKTKLGRVQSALNVARNWAKRAGIKPCTATAAEIIEAKTPFCSICRKRKKLVIDHCHKTGKFRGWLCINCNSSLGGFKDSPRLLNRAIDYLRRAK